MPSIQDVANQINAKLDGINQNTQDTVGVGNQIRGDLATITTRLDALDAHVQQGLADVSAGLFAIWELHKATNAVLEHHTRQHDTLICLLENTNELLCGMTRKLTRQLEHSERALASLERVEGIAERVHAEAAGDVDRAAQIEARLLECCPPERPEPERCPEPCPVPEHRPYDPQGQDWRPRRRQEPVG